MPLPPLVEPAAELTAEETARYSRQLVIPGFGADAQRRLKNARVLVIGAGGLGSPALLNLAAAGVGTIGIADFDTVEVSNLQRQVIHTVAGVGRSKTASARDAILALNPLVSVNLHELRLAPDNAVDLFARYDLIVDGTDNFATRYLVNDAAALAHKPYVWGSILRFSGQVSVFWEHAPDGRAVNYRDLHPEPPPPGAVPSCAEAGVLGVLCASIASIMGTEAIKLITGVGETLLGRLMIYDALEMTYRTIDVRKDPHAPPITGLADDAGLTPAQVRGLLDAGTVALIDVREPDEWATDRIDGAVPIPAAELISGAGLAKIPPGRTPVLYCRTGVRSAQALAAVRAAGFADALHLRGGIVAWAAEIEPDVPMC